MPGPAVISKAAPYVNRDSPDVIIHFPVFDEAALGCARLAQ